MVTITSHYARAALYGAHKQGRDIPQLLNAAGISERLLFAEEGRVHAEQMTALIKAIWDSLADEFMGFTGTPCKQGAFAMMCKLTSRCDTLDAMFAQGIEFYELISSDIEMQYLTTGDKREFIINMAKPEYDPEHFYQEFWLVIWHRYASWIIGQKIKLQAAYFSYPEPQHAAEFKYQFACPCYFSAEQTKLVFNQQYASLPPVRTQRELAQFLKRSPADLMTIPGDDSSLGRDIKSQLLNLASQQQPFPELEALANNLHMSAQSLRRKLREEGTNYQKLKDIIRCDIAIEKLAVQKMAVNKVAELLGFAEARSFTRAFKQWTGLPPSAYHEKL